MSKRLTQSQWDAKRAKAKAEALAALSAELEELQLDESDDESKYESDDESEYESEDE